MLIHSQRLSPTRAFPPSHNHWYSYTANHRHKSTDLLRHHPLESLVPCQRGQILPLHEIIEPLLPGASKDDICSEEQTISGPSVRHCHRLYLPIVQDGEDKVKCMWSGCSSVIKKDNYTRHVNEVHKRQIKAICTACGKKFPRPYMKKTHICPGRDSKHSSS